MKTLKSILGLCEHKWKQTSEEKFIKTHMATGYVVKIWSIVTLQCEKCGDIKSRSV